MGVKKVTIHCDAKRPERRECRGQQGGASMGVGTRGLDIKAGADELKADHAARAEAKP